VSDDGETAIVVIALVGNPFSPAYARARAVGRASPLSFASMNVALYARGATRWSLADRVIAPADRREDGVSLGASTLRWSNGSLVAELDERTTPFGRPVRGRVVLHPEARTDLELSLDAAGAHRWWPVAPLARVEVDLDEPRVRFRGHGYHDANAGDTPLEDAFDTWCWSRARGAGGALVAYDVREAGGPSRSFAACIRPDGDLERLAFGARAARPRTRGGLERDVHVETRLRGASVTAVHEVLSGERLRQRWVRFLAGFRVGRAA
jgi:carotenoid 1,2-hydratase